MPRQNNQRRRRRRRGQGEETENEERNTIFQSVWLYLCPLLLCLLSAATTLVHTLSSIPWVPIQLFFHLPWILLVCGQLGFSLLARVLSVCLKSILVVLLWAVWTFMLIGGVDLGCSIIRLTLLAAPFIMSKQIIWCVQLMVYHMWPSWLLQSFVGQPAIVPNVVEQDVDNGQIEQRAIVPNVVEQNLDNRQIGQPAIVRNVEGQIGQPAIVPNVEEQYVYNGHPDIAANLISVGDYVDQYPATTSHPTYQFQIPTREGLNLWQGFLDIVLDTFEGNGSYAGNITEDHLRMNGNVCRIELEATHPATFENLLLDLAQLATLLIVYFETPNLIPPRCIQQLYSAMTAPLLSSVPAPSVQQLENFVKFMRNQPGLKPVRKSSTFLSMVFQARRGMLPMERAPIDSAVALVTVMADWMDTVEALGYRVLNRTLWYRYNHPHNQVSQYKGTAKEVYRFLRNLFEHGGDIDPNGRRMVWDMEDLDYIAAEVFSDDITVLVWHLVMSVEMNGLLTHAWADYQRRT